MPETASADDLESEASKRRGGTEAQMAHRQPRPALRHGDAFRRRLAKILAMQVNMHEAKTRLSELVAAAERGEEVLIARDGKPAARLVPVVNEYPPARLGVLAGEIELAEDFDAPLPEFEPYSA